MLIIKNVVVELYAHDESDWYYLGKVGSGNYYNRKDINDNTACKTGNHGFALKLPKEVSQRRRIGRIGSGQYETIVKSSANMRISAIIRSSYYTGGILKEGDNVDLGDHIKNITGSSIKVPQW
jgi:hypothetical protein